MALAMDEAHKILRPMIRNIDKRADYSASFVEGDRPSVLVSLSMRNRSAKVTIPIEALTAAQSDAMRRNQLRTKIKQALDKMMFIKQEFASTKMVRGAITGDGFFRPSSGGRGRR